MGDDPQLACQLDDRAARGAHQPRLDVAEARPHVREAIRLHSATPEAQAA